MMELITQPNYESKHKDVVIYSTRFFENGTKEIFIEHQVGPFGDGGIKLRSANFKYNRYFSKFVFLKENELLRDFLNSIFLFEYNFKGLPYEFDIETINLNKTNKLKRFIEVKKEQHILKFKLQGRKRIIRYETLYWRIREEIISYLEQTKGETEIVKKLKELFKSSVNDNKTYDEYLDEKAKQLLKLDLSYLMKQGG